MMRWLLSPESEPYSREAALADRKQWLEEQEFLTAISHLDETELRLLINGIERGQSGVVPFEAALQEAKQEIDAYRAAKAA